MTSTQRALFPDVAESARDARTRRRVRPPDSGADTSREAAERIAPVASALAAQVFRFIAGRGDDGATDHEVQQALGICGDTERPRRWELERGGLIRDSGTRRRSPNGRAARVYVAIQAGRSAATQAG